MFCREEAVQVHREITTIHERGAELVFVGNGTRHFAKAFADEFGLTAPLYVDTKRDSYRALGMRRGFFATLGSLATFAYVKRALAGGFRQGATQGDAWQLGGVLVVAKGGDILYRHLSTAAGDRAPVGDILSVLAP